MGTKLNEAYRERRERLGAAMQRGVAIVPTAAERLRNRDTHHPYRSDSYFHYLGGFPEPEAALIIVAGDEPKSLLFCREKNLEREIWDGFRYGPDAAREVFGFDEAYPIAKLDELAVKLIANQPVLFYPFGADPAWDAKVMTWLNQVRAQARAGVSAPAEIRDVRQLLDEMRLIKSSPEIAVMRQAAAISTSAHKRAMQSARPGMMEYEIEAELLHEFRRHGAQSPAYTPIVAAGANACVLHYVQNNSRLEDGALLLIDAGCELNGYASDITRTFPVNSRFSSPQREVYELVLAAQDAAIAEVKTANAWDRPHAAAVKVLAQGMLDLGFLKGSLDEALEKETYTKFYMHRTGHWLGMDVHDAGDYKRDGAWRALQPGMVLTVEPGCYIRPSEEVPEEFWNIGIRIEDDVLVTAEGREVLTVAAPKQVAEIEALMRN
ncbi:MAG: aminopeptidase P N-terminal domain-containing protein [Burkholderiales bacterium]